MIGQIIGNYKIEEKLGEGGMGAVYKGVDTMLDREVAIKALRPELASQDSIVERFRTEAVTLAKLNHPNIATLYSMFRQGDELYMVLEFVRGETLDSIMKSRGALPAAEAIPVFCQVLDGIDHAHELGIVHRDIKPANMMLTEKGTLKVLDFGIARLLGSARMTRAGNIIGTLEYMAPEQVRGLETDGRSDIYALGMMLYEVLTGQLPFQTDNEFELMKAQTETTPALPRSLNPDIPEVVEAAIMRAIEKDPAHRFQTGGQFRDVLVEAGFADNGMMHGATGTFRKSSTNPSRPAVSLGGTVSSETAKTLISEAGLGGAAAATAVAATIKETRLGEPIAAPVASTIQPTRLVSAAPAAEQSAPAPASFFSKLSAVHYAGAGAVLLLLMGAVIAIPVFLFSGGSAPANANANSKSDNSKRPDIITLQQQPSQNESQTATQQPSSTANSSQTAQTTHPGGDVTPVENAPKTDKPAAKTDKPPSAVAQKPDTPKSQPPPQQAPPPEKPKGESTGDKIKKGIKGIFGKH